MTTAIGSVQRPSRTLPPGVKGPVSATLHLSVSKLVLYKRNGLLTLCPGACVLVHWWDEEKYENTETPLRLLPVCSFKSPDDQANLRSKTKTKDDLFPPSSTPDRVSACNPLRYTHTYRIISSTDEFTKYMSKHGDWELKVEEQISGKTIGVVRIPDLASLTTLSPLIKRYAVRTADRTKVGELTVALHYQPVSPPRTRRLHRTYKKKTSDSDQGHKGKGNKGRARPADRDKLEENLDNSEDWKTPACVARDARDMRYKDRDRWRISPMSSRRAHDSDSSTEADNYEKYGHPNTGGRVGEDLPRGSVRKSQAKSTIPQFYPPGACGTSCPQGYPRRYPQTLLENDDGLLRDVLRHFLRNDRHDCKHHNDVGNPWNKSASDDNQRQSSEFTYHRPPYDPDAQNSGAAGASLGNDQERRENNCGTGSVGSQWVWLGFGLCNQPRCTCVTELLRSSRVRVHLEDTLAYRTDVCLPKPLICLFQVQRHDLAALASRKDKVLIPIEFTNKESNNGGTSDFGNDNLTGVATVDIIGLCQSMCALGDVDATQPITLYNVHSPRSGRSKARIHVCTAAGSYAHVMRVLYQTSDEPKPHTTNPPHMQTSHTGHSVGDGCPSGAQTINKSDGMGGEESSWARQTNPAGGKTGIGDTVLNDRQCSSNPSLSGVRLVISAISPIASAPLNARACFTSKDEYRIKYRFPFAEEHDVTTKGIHVSANDISGDGTSQKDTAFIHVHTHPIVVTDARLKETMGQSLVFRLWRHHSSDNTECREAHFIGSVVVDLSGLSLGISEISGWYNVCDEHCHVLGQLKVHFHPRYTSIAHLAVPSHLQTSSNGTYKSGHGFSQHETIHQFNTQSQQRSQADAPDTVTSSIDTQATRGAFDVAPPSSLSHLYATISVKSESFLAQQLLNNMDELDKMNKALVALE